MNARHFKIIRLIAGLAILLWGFGCSPKLPAKEWSDKQAYIDARLFFSISYPQAWASSESEPAPDTYSDYGVTWTIEQEHQHNRFLTLSVISLPINGFPDHHNLTETVLKDLYPNLTINSREQAELPIGAIEQTTANSPQQTLVAWRFRTDSRHYLIIGGSSPEKFVASLPLFEAIAESFQPL